MQHTIGEAKRILRDQVRARTQTIPAHERETASRQACDLFSSLPCWLTAQSVLLFAPLPDELDVWPLLAKALAAGKRVALPRFVTAEGRYEACQISDPTTEVEVGRFAIREPSKRCRGVALEDLDLVVVPGVAFDLRGGRLGRGKGYYDQLLVGMQRTKCGVAFDEQVVAEVPMGPHDIRLDLIVTPTRWIEFNG